MRLDDTAMLNVLVGANGAGKTSVLEGIHVLGMGRSFRYRLLGPLVARGAGFLRVVGRVRGRGEEGVLGVERRGKQVSMRLSGESLQRTSQLARALPLLVIRPESHEVFSGGSEERRRVLDWAVFHVEPSFAECHARYSRALKQRNAGLRSRIPRAQLNFWNAELASSGAQVNLHRTTFLSRTLGPLQDMVARLVGFPVVVDFSAGWDVSLPLGEAIGNNFTLDAERGTTLLGPHRADLRFRCLGGDARVTLSRGEGKRLVLALLLALAEQIKAACLTGPVILVDDLASELDGGARSSFLSDLVGIGCQAFITTVDAGLIPEEYRQTAAMFHVERGTVARMI